MDISNFVDKKYVAHVLDEQTFWIGESSDIEVVVNLYEHKDTYKIAAWLNGTEEINTVDYEGSIDNPEEILAAMEKLVHDNEDYIISLATEDEE